MDLTKFDVTTINATINDTITAVNSKVTAVVRDGMYIAVGAGVVGVQQATEIAKKSAAKAQELKSAAEQAGRHARGFVTSAA